MYQRKKLLSIFAGLIFLMFLTALIPAVGSAAKAKKPASAKEIAAAKQLTAGQEFPVTGKEYLEWAKKRGMTWDTSYWPTKPVRGGTFQIISPFVYRADEPQPLAGQRLGDHQVFL